MISHFQGVFVLDGEKFADFSLARAKYSEKSRLSTSQLAAAASGAPWPFPLPPARKPRPMHRAEFCCVSCISFISCKGDFFNLAFLSLIRYRLFLRLLLLWQLLFQLFP